MPSAPEPRATRCQLTCCFASPARVVPVPDEMLSFGKGRIYRSKRRVSLGDVDPAGRLRLDSAARYLQDVAVDDARDAEMDDSVSWVTRRTSLRASRRPCYGEELELATWCSGTGTAWAERRTTVTGDDGPALEAVALWVSLDPLKMRPTALDQTFFAIYGEAAGSRQVRSRFVLPSEPSRPVVGRPWPLRRADFDMLQHVNNAVAWAAVEEEAGVVAPGHEVSWAEVEYRRPIEPGATPIVRSEREPDAVSVWMLADDGSAFVSARLGFDHR